MVSERVYIFRFNYLCVILDPILRWTDFNPLTHLPSSMGTIMHFGKYVCVLSCMLLMRVCGTLKVQIVYKTL